MLGEDVPFVSLAAFCDRVLQESDGTLSLIRIIDRVTVVALEGVLPEQMPAMVVHVNAALGFKSGAVQGTRDITLRVKNPQDKVQEEKPPFPVHFQGGNQGINLVFTLGFETRREGVHWIDVLVGDHVVTSMPLEVVYQGQQSEPAPTAPSAQNG